MDQGLFRHLGRQDRIRKCRQKVRTISRQNPLLPRALQGPAFPRALIMPRQLAARLLTTHASHPHFFPYHFYVSDTMSQHYQLTSTIYENIFGQLGQKYAHRTLRLEYGAVCDSEHADTLRT